MVEAARRPWTERIRFDRWVRSSDGFGADFSGANADALGEVDDEYFAVADGAGLGQFVFDLNQRLLRAFASISAFKFDYWGLALIDGARPTPFYNYLSGEADSTNDSEPDELYKFPAYATLDGIVLLRARINVLLWAVWARAVYFDTDDMSMNAALHIGAFLHNLSKGDIENPAAVSAGIDLYEAIVDGKDNGWIRSNVLTRDSARAMQTSGEKASDLVLWPTAGVSAPVNTLPWLGDLNLDDGVNFTRPGIFVPYSNMDLNPLSNSPN